MSSARRGNEAEAAVLSALVTQGYDVAVPFGEGQPYDLVVIGSGNAGQLAAGVARKAGWRVAIVEGRDVGGTCALPYFVFSRKAAICRRVTVASGQKLPPPHPPVIPRPASSSIQGA